jgi:hypothetical protein
LSTHCSGAGRTTGGIVTVGNFNEGTCHDHSLVAETMLEGAAAARPISS